MALAAEVLSANRHGHRRGWRRRCCSAEGLRFCCPCGQVKAAR